MSAAFAATGRSSAAIHHALVAWLDASGLDDPAVRLHLGHIAAALDAGEPAFAIDVGLAIGEALIGDWRPFAPVAAANHAFLLGLALLESVGDQELHPDWAARYGNAGPDVATLAAVTLVSCLPPLLLDDAEVSAAARAEAARLTSLGLWGAIRGRTLALTTDVVHAPSSAMADEIAALKDGAHIDLVAIFPLLAARDRAEVTEEIAAALRAFVAAAGRASQLAADLSDLFTGFQSRDVQNRRPTQPLLRALERLAGAERTRLLALLAARASTGDGLAEIRDLVTRSGARDRCVQDVERHLQRARRVLDDARLDSAALRAVVDTMTTGL